eukprot:TRINITY_DN7838_c0_g1_i1.p1 TRINITY_DN7838_c0_g1~~TRINITY_DN7838_c0_g1_i1.p1  ORF type:complete len:573 (-),score=104.86 TRINITY_DN7838_c0_g1_i1:158-1876(-)
MQVIDYGRMGLEDILSDMDLHATFWKDLDQENSELMKLLTTEDVVFKLISWITDHSSIQIEFNESKNSKRFRVSFVWMHGQATDEVYLLGTFLDNWQSRLRLRWNETHSLFYGELMLFPGEYQYKFIVNGEWHYSPGIPTVYDSAGNMNNLKVVEGPKPGRPTVIHVATHILSTQTVSDYLVGNHNLLNQFFSFISADTPKGVNVWDWFKVAELIVCAKSKGMELVKYFSMESLKFNVGEVLIDNISKEHVYLLLKQMLVPANTSLDVVKWVEQCNKPYFSIIDNIFRKLEKIHGSTEFTYTNEVELTNIAELMKIVSRSSPELTMRLRSHEGLSKFLVQSCFGGQIHPSCRFLIEILNVVLEMSKNLRFFGTKVDKPIFQAILSTKDSSMTVLKRYLNEPPFFCLSSEAVSGFRIDLIRTCLVMVKANYQQIHVLLYSEHVISLIFDLLFRFNHASIIHALIYEFFEALLECEEIQNFVSWLEDYDLIPKISQYLDDPKKSMDISPFLLKICYKLEIASKMASQLRNYLRDYDRQNPSVRKTSTDIERQKLFPPTVVEPRPSVLKIDEQLK